jgi:hypothetical protein
VARRIGNDSEERRRQRASHHGGGRLDRAQLRARDRGRRGVPRSQAAVSSRFEGDAARRARISVAGARKPPRRCTKMSEDGSGTGVSASLRQEKKIQGLATFILGGRQLEGLHQISP